ncbi:MAG: hypothetical protein COU06_01065 [Candidatus Harrisonbacteria bacterium CG10_big_fil_rev_8_21_14_0_10_38_8]|uniref:DoxX family protein n=1 Tax=Candidatus Harrisonbacteria bacterium CG10_big_fil_rev_8_21_14_0_10_38_8 TaxID=1974582 RepID=A0A2M6WKB5_9BACT|nr:MAG: hypothetical protein COU06_01065 [Candidatus Harrisonbacteria bacterium CG10_big_fil_rev_8_21_14_0_10_38_8]
MIQDLLIFNDWAVLVLRLAVGAIFIVHGYSKIKNFKASLKWFHSEGFKPGWFWGSIVTITELVGGVFILIGFLTHFATIALAINMVVATIFNIYKKNPFVPGYELDILLLASLILLSTIGTGALSLDNFFGIYLR